MNERYLIPVGGGPGNGKSNLAKNLADKLTNSSFYRAEAISLGDRLRYIARGEQVLYSAHQEEIIAHLREQPNERLSDEIVESVINDALSDVDSRDTPIVLLDGYPRYSSQVRPLFDIALFGRRTIPGVLHAVVDNETALARILKRSNDHEDRAITPEDAVVKLNNHRLHYKETLATFEEHEIPVQVIDTSGSREQSTELGFKAVLEFLRNDNPDVLAS